MQLEEIQVSKHTTGWTSIQLEIIKVIKHTAVKIIIISKGYHQTEGNI